MNEITMEKWSEEMIANIRLFEEYWKKNSEANKELYPECMGRGDWDEQFSFFCLTDPVSERFAK